MKHLKTKLLALATCLLVGAGWTTPLPVPAQDVLPEHRIVGSWLGTLEVGVSLRVVFNIETNEEGFYTGTLDSPDQMATGIPLGSITVSDDSVHIEIPAVAGGFEGVFGDTDDRIDGSWSQAGQVFPLSLEWMAEALPEPNRPQEPKPPFPYHSEDVKFENASAGITLAGTMTVPDGAGPFPAVALVTGSGPQNRDEELMGHKPFLVLADHLTRLGIAVLRYNDRGTNESGGDFASATSLDFVSDAASAIAYLRGREDVRQDAIGLAGHSEGGIIAPMVAAEDPDLGFIVLLAGPGVTGEQVLYAQAEAIMRANGNDEQTIRENRVQQEALFAIINSDLPPDQKADSLRVVVGQRMAGLSEADQAALQTQVEAEVTQLTSPWWRFFLTHDPRQILERVSCPVLSLIGENDLQVLPDQNQAVIEEALKIGGNPHSKAAIMSGLNHLFQAHETGVPGAYGQVEETFSPVALERISEWILDVTRAEAE